MSPRVHKHSSGLKLFGRGAVTMRRKQRKGNHILVMEIMLCCAQSQASEMSGFVALT